MNMMRQGVVPAVALRLNNLAPWGLCEEQTVAGRDYPHSIPENPS